MSEAGSWLKRLKYASNTFSTVVTPFVLYFVVSMNATVFTRPLRALPSTATVLKRASPPQSPPLFSTRTLHSSSCFKMPNKHNNKGAVAEHIEKDHASEADEAHQFQSGTSTHRKEDEWKHREPYRIHGDDEDFPVKWKGGCHCGKIKYQLSREKPLAAKFCHCTTCQRLHGVS